MIKKYLIISILSFGLLLSCSDDLLEPKTSLDENTKEEIAKNQHLIPVDKAISNLEDFLDSFNGKSRSGNKRVIKDYCTIKARQTSLARSEDFSDLDCENLLYVVNFENDEGYAVLAADDRIGEDVLAITDGGSYDSTAVAPGVTPIEIINPERVIIPEYPSYGDGFYKLMEYGDTLFINPNTVDFAIPAEQDTLVGNFFLDHIGAEDDFGNPANDPVNDSINYNRTIEYTTTALCISYASEQVLSSYLSLPTTNEGGNSNPTIDSGENGGPVSNGGAYGDAEVEYWYTNWETKSSVNPMLGNFIYWNQNSPFNDLYPKKRLAIIMGHKRRAPAGCFPLAVAKVLGYHKYPQNFTHNGFKINWEYLNNNYYFAPDHAAHLLKAISSGCDSWYFYQGTFTFPHKASSYMRKLGFSDAHNHTYSWNGVINCLNNGCPVIISGLPGLDIFHAHAWNIDGYKYMERIKTTIIRRSLTDVESQEFTEKKQMVHCDFGWRGKSNGYYISDVFNSKNWTQNELDNTSNGKQPKKFNYNRQLRIITYAKPN